MRLRSLDTSPLQAPAECDGNKAGCSEPAMESRSAGVWSLRVISLREELIDLHYTLP